MDYKTYQIEQKNLAPIQYKHDGLRELYYTIVKAISKGIEDVSLLDGETYQHDNFLRLCETHELYEGKRDICISNRRRVLCNLYADYCSRLICPFTTEEYRKKTILDAINKHFLDITDICKMDDELVKGCQRYLDTLKERTEVVEKQKAELRQAEEQKRVKREQWRNILYGDSKQGMTVIVPDKSVLNTKDSK